MERIYVIPLRKEFLKVPRWKRAKKSMKVIREFALRHMKADDVKISNKVNELIWSGGGKDVISKIRVRIRKEDKVAYVELPEEKTEKKVEKEKKGEVKKIKLEKPEEKKKNE